MIERLINKILKSVNNLPAQYKVSLSRILTGIIEGIIALEKNKVDKIPGKDLSTNDFTDELKNKLDDIEEGAEVNVNADWEATEGDAVILNKPSLEGYPDSAIWDSVNHKIIFKHNNIVLPDMEIDGTDFIKDGMIENIEIVNGYLVITFNTEAGTEPISIPLSEIFNPDNYYTKDAIDNKFYTKEQIDNTRYTKEQANNKFVQKVSGKQLSTEDYTTYEKSKLRDIEAEAQANKIEKIKVNDVEQEINNKEVNISVPDVSQFITKSVDNLVNYYLKSETYTKAEVQALIATIQQFHYKIYSVLPETGANNVLYLIGPIGTGSDKYEEYVYAGNVWTKIGDTSIDLSGYVTTEALNTALANYQTKLASGINIKTINNKSILGSGNIDINASIQKESSQPADGMLPNVFYELGLITENTAFILATGESEVMNHYYWTFNTGSVAPTISWPAQITSWFGGSAPTIATDSHYEISVLDGVAAFMEV